MCVAGKEAEPVKQKGVFPQAKRLLRENAVTLCVYSKEKIILNEHEKVIT